MRADCHIHAVLDGKYWKDALLRHSSAPNEPFIRQMLDTYRQKGYTYLRDGGDRFGACRKAKALAPEYGITYRIPCAPLCMAGHYGSFIGKTYENLTEYAQLVRQARAEGADFIKMMISGLMDFDRFGVLTEDCLPQETIKELIHIAHEEGFSVMAHANGAKCVLWAAEAGVDSVEHGAYLNEEALAAMAQLGTVWVPTLSTVCNLEGAGRFDDQAVRSIRDSFFENIAIFTSMGGLIAPGSDAGAWNVPHGCETELSHLKAAGVSEETLEKATSTIMQKF